MSALIVPLHVVRHAVQQSARLGIAESQATVAARVVCDCRQGFHQPTLRPIAELARVTFAAMQAGAA